MTRSVGQEVGNAEPRRDVDRLRDSIAPNEGQKLLALRNRVQLQQVILNLVMNSIEAMTPLKTIAPSAWYVCVMVIRWCEP